MKTDIEGLVNGHIVNDHILRSGDILPDGFRVLKSLGVTRVICLKNLKQDSPEDIKNEGLCCFRWGIKFDFCPLDSSGILTYDDGKKIQDILDIINNCASGKALVHCHHGSDRTGTVIACYRIKQGWTDKQAIKEMKGYGNAWYNFGMRDFVKDFYAKNSNNK